MLRGSEVRRERLLSGVLRNSSTWGGALEDSFPLECWSYPAPSPHEEITPRVRNLSTRIRNDRLEADRLAAMIVRFRPALCSTGGNDVESR